MADRRRFGRVHPDKAGLEKENAVGQEGPRYLTVDPSWRISDFPDPLAPKPNITASCPPGMTKDHENRLWEQLQKYKEQAKKLDNSDSA
ncbi:hypothetical protein jhhlp_007246 [Lomentospora prolificans]|uniref:Uncharacterized protein n=1 Tax=Lomentospora prolificans TaxID=41688 RepID=A0A2N3N240_9PEZI|nr:hypothetical protein jhhlp_007246 [Lomentospora prolificans]